MQLRLKSRCYSTRSPFRAGETLGQHVHCLLLLVIQSSLNCGIICHRSIIRPTSRSGVIGLVSPGAATDGVTLFFSWKKLTTLSVIASGKWWPFLPVVFLPLPSSHVVYPLFFLNSATKNNFSRCHHLGGCHSGRSATPSPPQWRHWRNAWRRRGLVDTRTCRAYVRVGKISLPIGLDVCTLYIKKPELMSSYFCYYNWWTSVAEESRSFNCDFVLNFWTRVSQPVYFCGNFDC